MKVATTFLRRRHLVGALLFWLTTISYRSISSFSLPRRKHKISSTTVLPSAALSDADAFIPTDETIPVPSGLSYFPFQHDVIRNYLVPSERILLADEMGLGKTISIIGGMNVLLDRHFNYDKQSMVDSDTSKTIMSDKRKLSSRATQFQTLIVAPKSVLSHWEYELTKWLTINDEKKKGKFKFKIGTVKAKQGIPDLLNENEEACVVYLINYDIVNKYREEIDAFGKLDLLVCDECHYLKNADAQRTQAVLGHHMHTESIKSINAKRIWLVTGSPVLNNPLELYPLLNAIDVEKEIFPELESLHAFREKYCRKHDAHWGVFYKGGKNLRELRNRLSERPINAKSRDTPIMIRRTKKEVLPDLPLKRHQLLPLDDDGEASRLENNKLQQILETLESKSKNTTVEDAIDAENLEKMKIVQLKELLKSQDLPVSGRKSLLIKRLIKSQAILTNNNRVDMMEQKEEEHVPDNEEMYSVRDSALSVLQSAPSDNRDRVLSKILAFKSDNDAAILGALMKARHQTALLKVPYAIELIEIASLSHKVVVFAHHRDVQDAIYDAFKNRAVAFNGDTTMDDRAVAVNRFQTDDSIKVFIGSIRAAGLGITLTAASHVIFLEMDWSPLIVQQAEDRCHRVGQKSSVLVQYLFFGNTIDEHLSQLLASKMSTVSASVDEPSGCTNWIFDFGKHEGETFFDVAGQDSRYLQWLVENDIHLDKDRGLTDALIELGFLNQKGEKSSHNRVAHETNISPASSEEQTDAAKEDAGSFVLPFGKHKSKNLRDVPRGYLVWMSSSGAGRGNRRLWMALQEYLWPKKLH